MGEVSAEVVICSNMLRKKWVAREMAAAKKLYEYGLPFVERDEVEYMSHRLQHGMCDRFLPRGLTVETMFEFIYNWNICEVNEQIKLNRFPHSEPWRDEKWLEKVKWLPTEAGLITCDFGRVMQPTSFDGWPFNLAMCDGKRIMDHQRWAESMGGSGLTSVEQLLFCFVRSIIERHLPLWGVGSARCRNAYGSDSSLVLCWDAEYGLGITDWYCSDHDYILGAVPEVFTAYDA